MVLMKAVLIVEPNRGSEGGSNKSGKAHCDSDSRASGSGGSENDSGAVSYEDVPAPDLTSVQDGLLPSFGAP